MRPKLPARHAVQLSSQLPEMRQASEGPQHRMGLIVVPTVRHTGSHFVLHLLGVKEPWRHNGVYAWRSGYDAHQRGEAEIVFDHLFPLMVKWAVPLCRDADHVFVPLRHPRLVAKSWRDRNHDVDGMVAMFDTLIEHIDPFDPVYLPIDHQDREAWLKAARDRTGLPLNTDWAPRGEKKGNAGLRWEDIERDEDRHVEELLRRHRAFFGRFYA